MAITEKNAMKTKNKKATKKNLKPLVLLTGNEIGPFYEYKMNREAAMNYMIDPLTGKKYKDAGDEQKFLCDIVNTQCGLKGTCVKVIIA